MLVEKLNVELRILLRCRLLDKQMQHSAGMRVYEKGAKWELVEGSLRSLQRDVPALVSCVAGGNRSKNIQ